MRPFKVAIVSPVHIQPSKEWVASLQSVTKNGQADVIIVDDSNGKIDLPFETYDYDAQEELLGHFYTRFQKFHKSAACKAFGIWLAYQKGYDIILILDSDCIVGPSFVSDHVRALLSKGHGWTNTIPGTGYYARGYPYSKRSLNVIANVGLWNNNLDLYGADRLAQGNPKVETPISSASTIAEGIIPFSGMNVAIWKDAAPALLFLPNFTYDDSRFTRHDDIWGGYIFQSIAKQLDNSVSFGDPVVKHDSPITADEDAKSETAMIAYEDDFFSLVDEAMKWVDGQDYKERFIQFATQIQPLFYESPFQGLIEPIVLWAELFNDGEEAS